MRLLEIVEKMFRRLFSLDFLKFNIVGGVGVIVNLVFYILFNDILKVHYLLSGALATELAILNNFILNDLWTFRGRRFRGFWSRLILFHASRILGLVATLGTLYLMVDALSLDKLFSYIVAIGVGVLVNFYTSDVYVWTRR